MPVFSRNHKHLGLSETDQNVDPKESDRTSNNISRKRNFTSILSDIIASINPLAKTEEKPVEVPATKKIRSTVITPQPKKVQLVDNFKQGDILFGLMSARGPEKKLLKAKGFTDIIANDLNSIAVQIAIDETATLKTNNKPKSDSHLEFLKRHKDYLTKPDGKPFPNSKLKPRVSAAFRRACKLLLINREPDRTINAHIIIKNINWKRVCNKTKLPHNKACAGITSSEMRAAYRDYVRSGPNPHIFFYDRNNNLMPQPPWELEKYKPVFERYRATFKK
jgi:hypothetical protein